MNENEEKIWEAIKLLHESNKDIMELLDIQNAKIKLHAKIFKNIFDVLDDLTKKVEHK